MPTMKTLYIIPLSLFLLLFVLLLSGCPSDGTSLDNDPGTEPVADAGADQTGQVGDLVTLDGSNSFDPDGAPLS